MVAPDAIEGWVAAGIITAEQAAAIRAFETTPTPTSTSTSTPRRTLPVIVEVLAYVGAALALAGVILVVVRAWKDLETVWRVAVTAGTTIALTVVGAWIPEARNHVFLRLRAVVWLAATGTATVFGVVLARDVYGTDSGSTIAWVAAACAFGLSTCLWLGRNRPVQEATTLIALAVAIGSGAATIWFGGVAGCFAVGLGLLFVVAGVTRRLPNRLLVEAVGFITVFFGLVALANEWFGAGLIFAVVLAMSVGLLALSPRPLTQMGDQIVFGVAAAFLILNFAPNAMGYFAQDAPIATGLAAWAVGIGFIALGVARRTRLPMLIEGIGGAVVIIGSAITAGDRSGFGKLFGLGSAVALLVIGMFPRRLILAVFGSIGVLVFVPWTIAWFFPGENRMPLLVAISGVLLLVISLLIGRASTRTGRPKRGSADSDSEMVLER